MRRLRRGLADRPCRRLMPTRLRLNPAAPVKPGYAVAAVSTPASSASRPQRERLVLRQQALEADAAREAVRGSALPVRHASWELVRLHRRLGASRPPHRRGRGKARYAVVQTRRRSGVSRLPQRRGTTSAELHPSWRPVRARVLRRCPIVRDPGRALSPIVRLAAAGRNKGRPFRSAGGPNRRVRHTGRVCR